MSRQELVEKLGIDHHTVGYVERGDYNPSLELAFRISELFGLSIVAVSSREPFRPLSEEEEVYGPAWTEPDPELDGQRLARTADTAGPTPRPKA